jgi:hypothetical protein
MKVSFVDGARIALAPLYLAAGGALWAHGAHAPTALVGTALVAFGAYRLWLVARRRP